MPQPASCGSTTIYCAFPVTAPLMLTIREPEARCLFAIARRDITPPVGIYHRMWGAANHDRSTGVHQPLTLTATLFRPLAAQSAKQDLVVLAIDHCMFRAPEMQALQETLQSAAGVQPDQLIVSFSHTHGAGLMEADRAELPGGELIPEYLQRLYQQAADAVNAARTALQPVTITATHGTCNLATHRDFYDENSRQWLCGFNPDETADPTVWIARVTNESGDLCATIVNYGCHPTTLAWDNTLISPDYPGSLRTLVEEQLGAPCVFWLGACGDVGPKRGFVGDVATAEQNGRQLGYAVLSALESLPPAGTEFHFQGPVISGASIATWADVPREPAHDAGSTTLRAFTETVDLPYRQGLPDREALQAERQALAEQTQLAAATQDRQRVADCRALIERIDRTLTRIRDLPEGRTYPLPIRVIRLGQLTIVAVEGEPYQSLQTTLRREFPRESIAVIALANGSRCSYLPDQRAFERGVYQANVAMLAPGCLESTTQRACELVRQMLSDLS